MPRRTGSTLLTSLHPTALVRSHWRLAGALALLAMGAGASCVSDPDCGVCDPDNLIIESIAGVNYAGKLVKLLGPTCVGDACPGELLEGQYFVDRVIPCVETVDALKAGRGVDEWCKISPLIVDSGLQFIFNNLLDPTSVELVRKQARNPQLLEVFDWKTHIVHLEGPITRFSGEYRPGASTTDPDRITRAQNLACIDNLRRQGIDYDHTVQAADPTICDGTHVAEDGKRWPLRTQLVREGADGEERATTIETWRGETDTRPRDASCTPAQSGPDICCETCDYELAVNVAKYGVLAPVSELEPAGDRRRDFASAIACDPKEDKLLQCRDFIPHVDRSHEVRSHDYTWGGERVRWRVPHADKVRETHPADRPDDAEQRTIPCASDQECTSSNLADLTGSECVGHLSSDPAVACRAGDDCVDKRCVAEWFAECRADPDTTGSQGYCVDRRWSGARVGGCFVNTQPYYICAATDTCAGENFSDPRRRQSKGSRLALADSDADGKLEAIEACRVGLGAEQDGAACDPLFQPGVVPVDRYDRLETLPTQTRTCVCEDEPAEGCQEFVDSLCREGGDPAKPILAEKRGQYAVKFVTRPGGVVYDPALKGVQFEPADKGGIPRSLVERCAEDRGVAPHNARDGWRAHDTDFELFEDADRAMCSSSEYKVVFTDPPKSGDDPVEYIRDKVGNTLRGKSTYLLRTPDFHVQPGSGFPTDNLRIGACASFQLKFSNKYDLSQDNLNKLELLEISADGEQVLGRVAGGRDCSEDDEQGVPCLTVDVALQDSGGVEVKIDTSKYDADLLKPGHRYRLAPPGLTLAPGETVFDVIAAGGERYRAAFWDACGMPLVTSMPLLDAEGRPSKTGDARDVDYRYDFTIDEPKPKEDRDQDDVQYSCDNAPDVYNPDQEDMDDDGYGDAIDLCPTIPETGNTADTDKDGVGNTCDRCPTQLSSYNQAFDSAGADAEIYMRVRNIPHQGDADQDGIGDACDNCVVAANCGGFGPAADGLRPAGVGDPVPRDDEGVCQSDVDELVMIGDVCAPGGVPMQLPDAAGPVGLRAEDDFDQDGLRNAADACPRLPLPERIACESAADCPAAADCISNVCNHVDSDGDSHGDLCDTCPDHLNPSQALSGGVEMDDPDGDFVGRDCETTPTCGDKGHDDPRPIAFYSEVSNGQCCVQLFNDALGLVDPGFARADDTGTCEVVDPVVPIVAECSEAEDQLTCRPLPPRLRSAPGILELPHGCTGVGVPLTLRSPGIDGDEDKLYQKMCLMPQADQDFDGIGDACDLCPFAFDPLNSLYKDANGKVWPNIGMFCNGDFDPEKEQQTCEQLAGDDTGGASSTGGEASSTG